MKKIILSFSALSILLLSYGSGILENQNQSKSREQISMKKKYVNVTFKVYGNCGMCKQTIENAILELKGVKRANWNMETKMITVKYNLEKVTLDTIQKQIAKSGYDTEKHRASKADYDKLHGCCQYERPNTK